MAFFRQNPVVQEVMSSLNIFNEDSFEANLWPDPSHLADEDNKYIDPARRQTFRYWTEAENEPSGFCASVLLEHTIRINSSVHCEPIPRDQFPPPCPGPRPFNTSFSNDRLDIRICAAGEYGTNPRTISRRRQDITEHLYLDVQEYTKYKASGIKFTHHCKASTTHGYFELGNYRNGGTYGPLLKKWPSPAEMAHSNDNLNFGTGAGEGPATERQVNHQPPSSSLPTHLPILLTISTIQRRNRQLS